MSRPVAIVAGEPNSISSEIIFKSWKLRKKYSHKPFIVIGSFDLLNLQKKKLKYKINIKKIDSKFSTVKINNKNLWIYNVSYNQNKPFEKINKKSNKYIFECFEKALKLVKEKKILGFVNCPISKETLFKNKHKGITEYISERSKTKGKEVMLIYNKKLSVSPLTTHIPVSKINNRINESKIIQNIITINNFYKKNFKKKPKINVLGLNPHNFSTNRKDKQNIIKSTIKRAKKLKLNVTGPISADTSFIFSKKDKPDVILGMYHDQVLAPFKTMFKFDAINITLGIPFIRISPDHGTAENIVGKNKANPSSLIESIKFFNHIK